MGNSIKSCCSAPQNEARGEYYSMTTFSSELQKLGTVTCDEQSDNELK